MSGISSILILVLISTIVGSVGSLFLKLGSAKFRVNVSIKGVIDTLKNYRLMFGILLYGGSSVFFIAALRLGDLSIVYPMTSMGYIFVTLLSAWILKEHINMYKICGIACIIIGVVLVTLQ